VLEALLSPIGNSTFAVKHSGPYTIELSSAHFSKR